MTEEAVEENERVELIQLELSEALYVHGIDITPCQVGLMRKSDDGVEDVFPQSLVMARVRAVPLTPGGEEQVIHLMLEPDHANNRGMRLINAAVEAAAKAPRTTEELLEALAKQGPAPTE